MEFGEEFPMREGVERVPGAYDARHLDGAALVFAATNDPNINSQVVRDAHRLGLFVNRADSDEEKPGDFTTPAVLRDGELVITVSAGGSPALAAAVRDGLRDRLDPRWSKMAAAMQTLRPRITGRRELAISRRREMLKILASDEALGIVDRDGVEALWSWLCERKSLVANEGGPPL
jgi:precorrin-2 dehydrogenase/sirohydrochlorin ferrochelatase